MGGLQKIIVWAVVALMASAGGAALADERFIDNGDGTITDRQLGVMWARSDNQGDISWHDALFFCRMGPPRALGKYQGWRMPNLAELESLYIADETYEGYETDCGQRVRIAPVFRLSCGWVWSAEVKSITARVFNFHRGYGYTDRMVHYKHYRALPVRDLAPGE